MSITHATTAVGTDAGTGEIHKAQWNAAHTGADFALLEQHTASSSATLDFTSFISSTYDEYLFEFVDVRPSTTNSLLLRCSVGGTFDSGSFYTTSQFAFSYLGSAAGGQSITTSILVAPFAGRTLITTANLSGQGSFRLYAPQGANYKRFIGMVMVPDSVTTVPQPLMVGWEYQSTSAIDGIRFFTSSGTIASGDFRVYGIGK